MFVVFNSFGKSPEQIGKAEPVRGGFKVTIFNGESTYLLQEGDHVDSYRVYKKISDQVIKRSGFGSWLTQSNEWIEFDLGNNRKAYINVDSLYHISPSRYEEVIAS